MAVRGLTPQWLACRRRHEPIQSAKLNGYDSYAYLKDVLARLPTQKDSAIDELLPYNWTPASARQDGFARRLRLPRLLDH